MPYVSASYTWSQSDLAKRNQSWKEVQPLFFIWQGSYIIFALHQQMFQKISSALKCTKYTKRNLELTLIILSAEIANLQEILV